MAARPPMVDSAFTKHHEERVYRPCSGSLEPDGLRRSTLAKGEIVMALWWCAGA
jgi:hypothetical protein